MRASVKTTSQLKVFVLLLSVTSMSVMPTKAETLSKEKETLWIQENRQLLLEHLKYSADAKFSDEFVSYKSGSPVVCGRVEPKNSFVGNGGSMRYKGAGTSIGAFTEDDTVEFAEVWDAACS